MSDMQQGILEDAMAEAPADYNKLAQSLTLPDGSHPLLERCYPKTCVGSGVEPFTALIDNTEPCSRCHGTGLVAKPYSMERVMAALYPVLGIQEPRDIIEAILGAWSGRRDITAAFLKAVLRALEEDKHEQRSPA